MFPFSILFTVFDIYTPSLKYKRQIKKYKKAPRNILFFCNPIMIFQLKEGEMSSKIKKCYFFVDTTNMSNKNFIR